MPKISYCSTCMNRGDQLKQTLEKNLEVIASLDGKAELCLVNFIKDPEGEEIHDWIMKLGAKPHFKYAISRELKHWHAPTAKNTAHLLGSGNFLINLDCDNFISPDSASTLCQTPTSTLRKRVFSGFTGDLEKRNFKRTKVYTSKTKKIFDKIILRLSILSPEPKKTPVILRSIRKGPDQDFNGTYGHIGLPKRVFRLIGGYDESFPPMGAQDKDILWRAYNCYKMELLHIPQPSNLLPILNDKTASLKETSISKSDWEIVASDAAKRSKDAIMDRELIANQGKKTGVKVEVVFS